MFGQTQLTEMLQQFSTSSMKLWLQLWQAKPRSVHSKSILNPRKNGWSHKAAGITFILGTFCCLPTSAGFNHFLPLLSDKEKLVLELHGLRTLILNGFSQAHWAWPFLFLVVLKGPLHYLGICHLLLTGLVWGVLLSKSRFTWNKWTSSSVERM